MLTNSLKTTTSDDALNRLLGSAAKPEYPAGEGGNLQTTIVGFPRVGRQRELKFAIESYFKGKLTQNDLREQAAGLRAGQRKAIAAAVDSVPGDFSFYDALLDAAVLAGEVPQRYRALNLSELDTYFAMARGYQGPEGDVKALPMKKWFNTNYHYIVPELAKGLHLAGDKPFAEFAEGLRQGVITRPVLVGPYTLLKLSLLQAPVALLAQELTQVYADILIRFQQLGADWVQLDEPALVLDLTREDISLFQSIYQPLLSQKGACFADVRILLQTYFGDVRDIYPQLTALPFDGIGIDFLEGKQSLSLLQTGFPAGVTLFAGVVNGKNIWRANYQATLSLLNEISKAVPSERLVLSTSCSLLHVPYTVEGENAAAALPYLAFAQEKLAEIAELNSLLRGGKPDLQPAYRQNVLLHSQRGQYQNKQVRGQVAGLTEADFTRQPTFMARVEIQKALHLPLFPTTTIGSFPQTAEVTQNRARFRRGEITRGQYEQNIRARIARWITLQEELGLDVLVHGEFERNDMVEYFGENLEGCLFTQNGWVQSYGTRCVKPPIIWGDVSRARSMTADWIAYAQSLTNKPVKGMLTGPVTILNWSFPREDIPAREVAFQIGLAIREEVLELEERGIRIIQVDEAALKEKLPLRRADWHTEYLDWAIPAFRLVHAKVKPETQIHTHMCYSEFQEIVRDIDQMDADVISFEASRSNLTLLSALQRAGFRTHVGPGVYDIHSPRVPSAEEILTALQTMLQEGIQKENLWVNPDCGLKTRGEQETLASLKNLVAAARQLRSALQ